MLMCLRVFFSASWKHNKKVLTDGVWLQWRGNQKWDLELATTIASTMMTTMTTTTTLLHDISEQ